MSINLDKLSADFSQKILVLKGQKVKKDKIVTPESIEKMCTSTLGVLQEQGVYASILYLLSRSGDKTEQKDLSMEEFVACGIVVNLINILNSNELKQIACAFDNDWDNNVARVNGCKSKVLKYISDKVAVDLKKLLLVKSLYEQTLIYAQYGAKALSLSEGT